MTRSRIDELVAGLTAVRDDQVPGPATPGARALLNAVTAEGRTPAPAVRAAVPTGTRRRRRYGRITAGTLAATAAATVAVVALNTGGPGPIRSYANAAVDIRRTDGSYRVRIKDAYADQARFHEAFARFGLDVTLSIVPVAPGRERKLISIGTEGDGNATVATVLVCPPGRGTTCPLTVELSGPAVRRGRTEITIGRTARAGEPYRFQRPAEGDAPPSLRLTGRTVAGALARLRLRNLTAVYVIGRFHEDGSGGAYTPPPAWRPRDDRRVTGAWMHSSDAVTLLLAPAEGDPPPTSGTHDLPG